jgi:four helix bundle protein
MLAHEKLRVYQLAVDFNVWVGALLDELPNGTASRNQLDRAATPICLNIAEGAGRFTSKDQARFYSIARGSALECGACLDVIAARRHAAEERVEIGKGLLEHIVSMLVRLAQSTEDNLLFEETEDYTVTATST